MAVSAITHGEWIREPVIEYIVIQCRIVPYVYLIDVFSLFGSYVVPMTGFTLCWTYIKLLCQTSKEVDLL